MHYQTNILPRTLWANVCLQMRLQIESIWSLPRIKCLINDWTGNLIKALYTQCSFYQKVIINKTNKIGTVLGTYFNRTNSRRSRKLKRSTTLKEIQSVIKNLFTPNPKRCEHFIYIRLFMGIWVVSSLALL